MLTGDRQQAHYERARRNRGWAMTTDVMRLGRKNMGEGRAPRQCTKVQPGRRAVARTNTTMQVYYICVVILIQIK